MASLAAWAACFFLDARITASFEGVARYESNIIFRTLAKRLGARRAVPVQALFEAVLVLAVASLVGSGNLLASAASVSEVFGLAHLLAWHSNKRFLASRR